VHCSARAAGFFFAEARFSAAAAAAAALGRAIRGPPTKSYVRVYGFEVTAVTQPATGNIMPSWALKLLAGVQTRGPKNGLRVCDICGTAELYCFGFF
jgi:hypothetical protein